MVFRGVLDGEVVFGALLRKSLFVGDIVDVDMGAEDCGDPGGGSLGSARRSRVIWECVSLVLVGWGYFSGCGHGFGMRA